MRRSMLSQAPSHCLKLRGMFSSAKDYETKFMYLKEALLQKIAPVKPIHVYVEKDSKEGVMFARFASLTDCSCAFKSLHGTWFNGQLFVLMVTLKNVVASETCVICSNKTLSAVNVYVLSILQSIPSVTGDMYVVAGGGLTAVAVIAEAWRG
ncbi:unnamed protein product [Wuchereria bancrofti]|uniref:RRM domain-containing protein n=1 Tax=Wuchereria bancrofti TaxID=6293 RepID=A0A3P7G263_WUCBA|nr:unnamed protein product [Wuchereria bancrofti]